MFEVFTGKNRKLKFPVFTILKNRQACFSKSAIEKYLKDAKYLNLLYDKSKNKIGFIPTNTPSGKTFKICRSINGQSLICLMAFAKHYKLEPQKYSLSMKNKMLVASPLP